MEAVRPWEIWYNVGVADIIPAHTVFCVYRRKSGAEFRRRPVSAKRIWYSNRE
ncbi:hypothetical protein HMPREF1548_05065 [Clostridium sp. KLE 1755]|nr:hypothetical protein HMPREF1548_05065 [Clostridium sp. KLE 1755]